MIKVLKNKEIDKAKWDLCIDNSQNNIIYAYSWYLDIVTQNKWQGLIIGDYEIVMPIVEKKKFTLKYLYQPVLTQQLGIFSKNKIDEKTIDLFINYIEKNYSLAEIMLNYGNNINNTHLTERTNLILSLNKTSDQIRKEYSDNTKRNIKKAKKCDFKIVSEYNFEKIFQLFYTSKGKKLKLSNSWYSETKRITNSLRKQKIAETSCISNSSGQIICGFFHVTFNNRIYLLFSGTSDEAKQNGAMHYLIDTILSQNADSNIIFDFEGSNDKNLSRFFRGFGATEQNYPFLKINNLPRLLKIALRKK